LFAGIKAELDSQSKKVLDNGLQNFANNIAIQGIQKNNTNSVQEDTRSHHSIGYDYGNNERYAVAKRATPTSGYDG
jgi:hypothetical protein